MATVPGGSPTRLMDFPDEILLLIISQIEAAGDLCSLAVVGRRLQSLVEPSIYRSIKATEGEKVKQIAFALQQDESRPSMIEELLVSCPFDEVKNIGRLQYELPSFSRLRSLRLETPDCNQKNERQRVHWLRIQSQYEYIFRAASLLNAQMSRPLENLRSCTIHFVDHQGSRYQLVEYASLLLHPTLEDLSLSCAFVSQQICDVIGGWGHTTALKSLMLEQCDFDAPALRAILSLPKALRSLHLSENFHHPPLARPMTRAEIMECLSPVASSLADLTLLLNHTRSYGSIPYETTAQRREKFDFSTFESLTTLTIGTIPFFVNVYNPEIQAHYNSITRIGLNRVTLPPYLESFRYHHIQTSNFTDNIEVLRKQFYNQRARASLEHPRSAMSAREYGSLRSVDAILPLTTHGNLTLAHLRELSSHAFPLNELGIRFRVFDTDKPCGYIPPYLYGEKAPAENLIIDSDRINMFKDAKSPIDEIQKIPYMSLLLDTREAFDEPMDWREQLSLSATLPEAISAGIGLASRYRGPPGSESIFAHIGGVDLDWELIADDVAPGAFLMNFHEAADEMADELMVLANDGANLTQAMLDEANDESDTNDESGSEYQPQTNEEGGNAQMTLD